MDPICVRSFSKKYIALSISFDLMKGPKPGCWHDEKTDATKSNSQKKYGLYEKESLENNRESSGRSLFIIPLCSP